MDLSFVLFLLFITVFISGCFTTSTSKTPQEWNDIGDNLFGEGRYEDAIVAFNHAIEIDPKNEMAWFGKVSSYVKLGKYKEAREAANRFREADHVQIPSMLTATLMEDISIGLGEKTPYPTGTPTPHRMSSQFWSCDNRCSDLRYNCKERCMGNTECKLTCDSDYGICQGMCIE